MRLRDAASSDLLSAFAIAVATSSPTFSMRSSASGGSSSLAATTIAPQRRPSTTIGLATVHTVPGRPKPAEMGPPTDAK